MNLISKMPDTDKDSHKVVDNTAMTFLKFWPVLLASALTLVSVGGIYVKVDYIAETMKRNDAQIGVMNDRQNLTSQSIIEIRGQLSNLNTEALRINSNVADANRRIDILSDKARWTPNGK